MSYLPPLRSLFEGPHKPVVIFDLDNTLSPTGNALGHELYLWVSQAAGVSYDEAKAGCREEFARHGHVFWPLKRRFGLRDEQEEPLWRGVTAAFHRNIHQHIGPNHALNAQLRKLALRTTFLGVFTANDRYHADTVIPAIALDDVFPAPCRMGRSCVGHHSKVTVDAYRLLEERHLRHIPPCHPRIMVEDMGNNLPGARAMGHYTVHVGGAAIHRNHRYAVDYSFPTVMDAVTDMCGGR